MYICVWTVFKTSKLANAVRAETNHLTFTVFFLQSESMAKSKFHCCLFHVYAACVYTHFVK